MVLVVVLVAVLVDAGDLYRDTLTFARRVRTDLNATVLAFLPAGGPGGPSGPRAPTGEKRVSNFDEVLCGPAGPGRASGWIRAISHRSRGNAGNMRVAAGSRPPCRGPELDHSLSTHSKRVRAARAEMLPARARKSHLL